MEEHSLRFFSDADAGPSAVSSFIAALGTDNVVGDDEEFSKNMSLRDSTNELAPTFNETSATAVNGEEGVEVRQERAGEVVQDAELGNKGNATDGKEEEPGVQTDKGELQQEDEPDLQDEKEQSQRSLLEASEVFLCKTVAVLKL